MKILYVSVWLREVRREGGLGGGGKYDEKKVLKWLKMAYMQKNIWENIWKITLPLNIWNFTYDSSFFFESFPN